MPNAQWFALIGTLLLFMGLTKSGLKRSPVTSAIIYLAVGLIVGPTVLNLLYFKPIKESTLLEVLTEVTVLISLFSAGLKMPVPFSLARSNTAGNRVISVKPMMGVFWRLTKVQPAAGAPSSAH